MSNQYQLINGRCTIFYVLRITTLVWQRLVISLIRWMLIIVERQFFLSLFFSSLSFSLFLHPQRKKTAIKKSSHIILYRYVSAIMSSSQMTFRSLCSFSLHNGSDKGVYASRDQEQCDHHVTCVSSVPLLNE